MSSQFTKRERAILRGLAAEFHQLELENGLTDLYEKFSIWNGNGMNAFELNEAIHQFHDGLSRELYKTYVLGDPGISVAIGIYRQLIDPGDLDKALYSKIAIIVDAFSAPSTS